MTVESFPTPRYIHHCDKCIFMGRDEEYDMYYCPDEEGEELFGGCILARYSNEGGDYLSCRVKYALIFAASPQIATAAKKLLQDGVVEVVLSRKTLQEFKSSLAYLVNKSVK